MSIARNQNAPTPVVVTPQTPAAERLDMVGEQITVLARGSQTGSYEVFLQEGLEGSGPPPHHHPWDEAFFVTRGELAISIDGVGDVMATAGCFVHVPGNTVHSFRFGAGGGTMVSITSEEGAADFFTQLAQLPPGGSDLAALIAIAAERGLTILPPAGM